MSAWSDRQMRHPPVLPVAGAVVLLAGLTAGVLQPGVVRSVDWQVHLWVDDHLAGDLARGVSTAASMFGQRGVVVVPLLIVTVLAARRYRSVRPIVVTVAVLVGIALGVMLFKELVGRLAPGAGRDAVNAGGLSYPSGHAVNAVVCWALVLEFTASLGPRAARVLTVGRRRVLPALFALAAGIGMTTLDYHWVSDTIAGWLLGALILAAVLAIGPVPAPRKAADLSQSTAPAPARPAPSA